MKKKKKKAIKVKVKRAKVKPLSLVTIDNGLSIPSIKLKCVGVHKIQDKMTCDRLYFWRWVLNLQPSRVNLNFWFGSLVHLGIELLCASEPFSIISKALDEESKRLLVPYTLDARNSEEVKVQLSIAKLILKVYNELNPCIFKGYTVRATEVRYKRRLELSPVDLIGTLDLVLEKTRQLSLSEHKTATRITQEYFTRLKFDKQINSYAIGAAQEFGKMPKNCLYNVFRKPSISRKQTETTDAFLTRFEDDLHARPKFYFLQENIPFGKRSVYAVLQDIEWAVFDLYSKYSFLNVDKLLNPFNWSRNDRACFNYGVCPYFLLCKNCHNYDLYLRYYMMRDIRHEEELEELSKKRIVSAIHRRKKLQGTYKLKKGKRKR